MRKSGRKLLGIMLAASLAITSASPMQGVAAEQNDSEYQTTESGRATLEEGQHPTENTAQDGAAKKIEETQPPTGEDQPPAEETQPPTGEGQSPSDESQERQSENADQSQLTSERAENDQPPEEGTEEIAAGQQEPGLELSKDAQPQQPAAPGQDEPSTGEGQSPSDEGQEQPSGNADQAQRSSERAENEQQDISNEPKHGENNMQSDEEELSSNLEQTTFMLQQENGAEGVVPFEGSYDIHQPVIERFELEENGQTLTQNDTIHFNI